MQEIGDSSPMEPRLSAPSEDMDDATKAKPGGNASATGVRIENTDEKTRASNTRVLRCR